MSMDYDVYRVSYNQHRCEWTKASAVVPRITLYQSANAPNICKEVLYAVHASF